MSNKDELIEAQYNRLIEAKRRNQELELQLADVHARLDDAEARLRQVESENAELITTNKYVTHMWSGARQALEDAGSRNLLHELIRRADG